MIPIGMNKNDFDCGLWMSLVTGPITIFFLFRVLYFYFIQSMIRAHKPVSRQKKVR